MIMRASAGHGVTTKVRCVVFKIYKQHLSEKERKEGKENAVEMRILQREERTKNNVPHSFPLG